MHLIPATKLISKILFFWYLLFALPLLAGCSAFAPNQEQNTETRQILDSPMTYNGQILLRLAIPQRDGHPLTEAGRYFAQLTEEKTNHRIRIILYTGNAAGKEEDIIKEVIHGSTELAQVSIDNLTSYNQQLVTLEMPFLYEDSNHMWQILEGDTGKAFLTSMKDKGLEGLCWYDAGARNLYTSQRRIRTPEDLDKLRIQVKGSSFLMDVISTLGALPMDLSDRDMNEALKKGQADGIENDITGYIASGLHTQASLGILTEHIRIPEMLIINDSVLCQLDEEDQQALRNAALEASIYQRALWKTYEEEQMKLLEQAGVQWITPADKNAFKKKVWGIYEIYGYLTE